MNKPFLRRLILPFAGLLLCMPALSGQDQDSVAVGYGARSRASLAQAVSVIRGGDITVTKQSDLLAALQGKVAGLLIRQKTGGAGDFNTDLSLRGYGEPLVIVDGLIRTAPRRSQENNLTYSNSSSAVLAQLNPEDIESITVLKDASAAIYGIGAENGVILITTKQGKAGAPSVRYSNRFSFGVPTALPDEVDILTWFSEANAMYANVGKDPVYSQTLIDHYKHGDKGYTDNRWYSQLYRNLSFEQNHQVSLDGGGDRTRYYLSASFSNDNGILNGPQLGYKSLSLLGNVTTDITKDLRLVWQSSLLWNKKTGLPQNADQNLFTRGLYSERFIPWQVPDNPSHWTYNPGTDGRNAVGAVNGANGYDKTGQYSFVNNLSATYSAPFLEGLRFQGQLAYEHQSRNTRQLTLAFPLYDAETDGWVTNNKDDNYLTERWFRHQTLYGRLQADYTRSSGNHSFGAMLGTEAILGWEEELRGDRGYGDLIPMDILSMGIDTNEENRGTRSSSARVGYFARVNYDYGGRYLAEAAVRCDGSSLYARGHRWAVLPSYAVAWRISREEFFKHLLPFVSELKVRWSDGVSGGDQPAALQSQMRYLQTGSSYVFNDGTSLMGYSATVAEAFLSWTRTRMRDFGIDWEIREGLVGGSVDWFWRDRTGIAEWPDAVLPDMFGATLPPLNLNAMQNVGIDLALTHGMQLGDFRYRIAAAATFARARDTYISGEQDAVYSSAQDYYDNHTEGRWNNALNGKYYEWNGKGQFTSWNDIFDYPVLYSTGSRKSNMSGMLPGMYKIDDRNGDGVITSADRYTSWKEGMPPLQYGLTLFLDYKNFDFSAAFNGAALSHKSMQLSGGMGYGWSKTLFENHLDHYRLAEGYKDPLDPQSVWEPGYWPALAPATGAEDASSNATYRYAQPYSWVNNAFFRLKSLEVGYTFPEVRVRKACLRSVRVYAGGTNLLTFCDPLAKVWDPETYQSSRRGASGAPLLRTFVLGTNIRF